MTAQVVPLPVSDDAIIRRAQLGDVRAFDRIYEEHVGRVFAVCLRMCCEHAEAEQLTQDVFVRMWRQLPSFRGESLFSTWLHRLAVNVVLQERRSAWRRRTHLELGETAADTATPPVDVDNRLDLDAAIAALPERARIVLVLHDIEGYTHEEIAELCGMAVGTAKAQLHRARRLLRERLNR